MRYQNQPLVSRIWLQIDRFIRSHKHLVLGFVAALLIISTLPYEIYTKAAHSIPTVGSCQKPTSVKIIDESGGGDPKIRHTQITPGSKVDSPFYNYVSAISQHFFLKIDENQQCKGDLNNDPQIELSFVYRPLISYGIAPFDDLKWTQASDSRQLDSP
jgi:hypothetical protein